ncbi:UNVERIFIED_CONTAM: hypothetical protein HDU68_008059 [Siphonaria sp. JEL0065]|nr:hypothetical protein HDU68_008059 [Siphonaria sp. JEL0065]
MRISEIELSIDKLYTDSSGKETIYFLGGLGADISAHKQKNPGETFAPQETLLSTSNHRFYILSFQSLKNVLFYVAEASLQTSSYLVSRFMGETKAELPNIALELPNEDSDSKEPFNAPWLDVFAVIKNNALFIYSSDETLECRHVLTLHHYQVILSQDRVHDHEIYQRHKPLQLILLTDDENSPDPKSIFIYTLSNSEKEDCDIVIKDIDIGDSIPILSNPRLVNFGPSDTQDIIVDLDLKYTGGIQISASTIATISVNSLNLSPFTIPITVSIKISHVIATVRLKIKSFHETSRVWVGLHPDFKIGIQVDPVISNRLVKLDLVNQVIGRRVKGALGEFLVLPNMDDFGFWPSGGRGGFFWDDIQDESGDDFETEVSDESEKKEEDVQRRKSLLTRRMSAEKSKGCTSSQTETQPQNNFNPVCKEESLIDHEQPQATFQTNTSKHDVKPHLQPSEFWINNDLDYTSDDELIHQTIRETSESIEQLVNNQSSPHLEPTKHNVLPTGEDFTEGYDEHDDMSSHAKTISRLQLDHTTIRQTQSPLGSSPTTTRKSMFKFIGGVAEYVGIKSREYRIKQIGKTLGNTAVLAADIGLGILGYTRVQIDGNTGAKGTPAVKAGEIRDSGVGSILGGTSKKGIEIHTSSPKLPRRRTRSTTSPVTSSVNDLAVGNNNSRISLPDRDCPSRSRSKDASIGQFQPSTQPNIASNRSVGSSLQQRREDFQENAMPTTIQATTSLDTGPNTKSKQFQLKQSSPHSDSLDKFSLIAALRTVQSHSAANSRQTVLEDTFVRNETPPLPASTLHDEILSDLFKSESAQQSTIVSGDEICLPLVILDKNDLATVDSALDSISDSIQLLVSNEKRMAEFIVGCVSETSGYESEGSGYEARAVE